MISHFKKLEDELPTIQSIANGVGPNAFYAQEVLRFRSIAGTLLNSFHLEKDASIDERYITHILARSLLENYFWLIYLFDDPAQKQARYDQLISSFKREYLKLTNEKMLPHKDQLEKADLSWSNLSKALDVNSMLAQIKNDYGDRLNYLYFVYRISSFDTHGKNLNTIFQTVFEKKSNFPILDLKFTFDLIANQYLVILQELHNQDEI